MDRTAAVDVEKKDLMPENIDGGAASGGVPDRPVEDEVVVRDDFTMFPYEGRDPLVPKFTATTIIMWVIGGIIAVVSLGMFFAASASSCQTGDNKCQFGQAFLMSGAVMGLFIAGILGVAGVAWTSSVRKKEAAKARKEQQLLEEMRAFKDGNDK